jgi:hypothetical protein
MYATDELDTLAELSNVPRPEPGAPCPIVFAEEHGLVLSYWVPDEPHYQPTTAPLGVVRFGKPYMHLFGPPDEDAIAGHPLSGRGLYPCGVFRVDHSSLVRCLERMNAVQPTHDPRRFEALVHYIFTFHDSTFECVAESLESTIEHVGLDEEYSRTLQFLRNK